MKSTEYRRKTKEIKGGLCKVQKIARSLRKMVHSTLTTTITKIPTTRGLAGHILVSLLFLNPKHRNQLLEKAFIPNTIFSSLDWELIRILETRYKCDDEMTIKNKYEEYEDLKDTASIGERVRHWIEQ